MRLTGEVPGRYPDKKQTTTTEVIMYIPGIPPLYCAALCLWIRVTGGQVSLSTSNSKHLFGSVSEETTTVPYVDPLYEEYDYADCTSVLKIISFIHNAGLDD